eukprot:CAMPEP_0172410678 /NCGR_PEP_ID=MMETSP1061-20121228/77005_1 /TAXON_ID=37318 /ORGANISM="Pseudo-nitzschia pungens, Strain cf. pungens" /LENGTH=257 /DNA_ID=CAMNT_0013146871 /DNA_START=231 /DNA_END=1005 /DNA_ORIENTATION=+
MLPSSSLSSSSLMLTLTSSLCWKTTAVWGVRAFQFRPVAMFPRSKSLGSFEPPTSRLLASVTGPVYDANPKTDTSNSNSNSNTQNSNKVTVTLYTKEGCTLCDKVKDVLAQLRDEPNCHHALRQVDITDDDQTASWDRYKYDIPVLHIQCGDGIENGSNGSNGTDGSDSKAAAARYKYDIPVLHIQCGDGIENGSNGSNGTDGSDSNGSGSSDSSDSDVYWTKHRLTEEEAREALAEARTGSFRERRGRPNAAAMER